MKQEHLRRFAREFGVIVLGVLTALTLETAYQRWQEVALEGEYLEALRAEAEGNLRFLRFARDAANERIAGLDSLLSSLESGETHGARAIFFGNFSYQAPVSQAVLVDLQTTGNIRLIRDAELRRKVMGTYAAIDAAYARLADNASRGDSRLMNLVSGYEGRYPTLPRGESAEDLLQDLRSDPDLRPELGRERRRHAAARTYTTEIVTRLEDLVEALGNPRASARN